MCYYPMASFPEEIMLGSLLSGRDFLTLADFSKEEIHYLLDLAQELKRKQLLDNSPQPLKGKTLGMLFEKASTRTRISFEAGMYQLGGNAIFLRTEDLQLARGEAISDTARVLSSYLDGIMIRANSHEDVKVFAKQASIPVINGLTDMYHPCQVLADLLTIKEIKGTFIDQKLVFIGDGNNMAHSLMLGAAQMGMSITIVTPKGYEPNEVIVKESVSIAHQNQGNVEVTNCPRTAVQDADILYTDVWTSMGQEAEQVERAAAFSAYQVDSALVLQAKKDAIFMHCLPAHRGEEVTASVIDGLQSVVFQQAENRLHAQKALLTAIIGK